MDTPHNAAEVRRASASRQRIIRPTGIALATMAVVLPIAGLLPVSGAAATVAEAAGSTSSEAASETAIVNASLTPVSEPAAQRAVNRLLAKAAQQTGFTVVLAAIDAGKLEIRGVTARPNALVILDGRHRTRSKANRFFSFSLAYRPTDCRATLKSLAKTVRALVQSCAPDGDVGGLGPRGPQGPEGDSGRQGPAGAAGPVGATGEAGLPGPKGETGVIGDPGPDGPKGPVGAAGPVGDAGAAGVAGPVGATGPTGVPGPIGDAGPQGPAGPAGFPGAQGPVGPVGFAGAPGPQGPPGHQGNQGLTGATGPKGATGEDMVASLETTTASVDQAVSGLTLLNGCIQQNTVTEGGPVLIIGTLVVEPDANATARPINTFLRINNDDFLVDTQPIASGSTGLRAISFGHIHYEPGVGPHDYAIAIGDSFVPGATSTVRNSLVPCQFSVIPLEPLS